MQLIVFLFAAVVPVLWLTLFVRSHQLFYAFRDRYPDEAKLRIEHAFTSRRSPSKFLYFLSADSVAFLRAKGDGDLLSRRSSVIRLSIAALFVPFGGMGVLAMLILTGVLQ